jgi:uncharacterized C2H2 Zn-finger protein
MNCLNCNIEIKKGKYCSQKCSKEYIKNLKPEFECEKCGRLFKKQKVLDKHYNKCLGRCICGKTILRGKHFCSQECYIKHLNDNPELKKELTKNANEKCRELGSNGLHWCQLDNEKAKQHIQKWHIAGVEKNQELCKNKQQWMQIDKEKVKQTMEKIHTQEAHKKLSKSLKGRKFTLEHRNNISKVRKEKGLAKGEKNPMFGKSPAKTYGYKYGFREDIGHYVRCAWEANYARILKYLNIDYEFEFKRLVLIKDDGEKTTYLPDFKIGDVYVEIKGRWYDDAKEKIELFKQQYPNHKLVIIEYLTYNRLMRYYKDKIKEWE